ncbi:MAG: hypothetical protein OEQ12_06780 [Nitrosopumilus sp.]|nr:hypothetical protein [Nitrosopumilus sp.]
MDDEVINHLRNLYELNSEVPHRAFAFPRLPPGLTHPMFKTFENPTRDKFVQNASTLNKKLDGFQKMYQQHVSGLMAMNSSAIIPPGHPLYSQKNSIDSLKMENDKLFKQNTKLKKKLDRLET